MGMKRTIAISDIHGCPDALRRLLDKVGYVPAADRLLLLGDYVGRGPDSKGALDALIRLKAEGGASVVLLKGNHDHRFLELMKTGHPGLARSFLEHGGKAALSSYGGWPEDRSWPQGELEEALRLIRRRHPEHVRLLQGMELFAEDERFIYAHAGLDPVWGKRWKKQPAPMFYTIREPFLRHPVAAGKTVVFGHTQTRKLQDGSGVWNAGDKIGIDGGCAYGHQLNALLIDPSGSWEEASVPAKP
ncbi:serine/threonine protein phosphatase [Paenibacillus pasadenensis]|uniref:Serine/threonine protein phosphatase n=1 Tax=Paenibacillus pasadenensis TaxID=217090 RepID=A0A2N5N6T5_9BACL|nr:MULTISPECIES: metallophosphoesterase family protein [Paenibacillus]PLT46064.1 serine/threonine protein phosphatase [Paenibacillus pasadenensis]